MELKSLKIKNYKQSKILKYIVSFIVIVFVAGTFFSFLKESKLNNDIIKKDINLNKDKIENSDVIKQGIIKKVESKKMKNPPEEIRAIYLTAWSAGNFERMDKYIDLLKRENLNAVVIDIKDATGYIAYDIKVDDVVKYGAINVKINQIDDLIAKLHSNGIYVIARIVVFKDPIIAKQRPEWAIKNNKTGGLWENYKGVNWIDPASTEYLDYIVKIAKATSDRGFDEINFDYIRFPSDGLLSKMSFPFYDSEKKSKRENMKEVFEYFRLNLSDIVISVDFFGLVTVSDGDLGIGQIIEDAFENFDYVCPMVYPSHYAKGFIGFENPAEYPYEVVKYSIKHAFERLEKYRIIQNEEAENPKKSLAKIRPWLQAFDMGEVYGPQMIRAQINASNESGGLGWILWNASNRYSTKIIGINNSL